MGVEGETRGEQRARPTTVDTVVALEATRFELWASKPARTAGLAQASPVENRLRFGSLRSWMLAGLDALSKYD